MCFAVMEIVWKSLADTDSDLEPELLFRMYLAMVKARVLILDFTCPAPNLIQANIKLRNCLLDTKNRAKARKVNFETTRERESPANDAPQWPARPTEKNGTSEAPITQMQMVVAKHVAIHSFKRGNFRFGISRKIATLTRVHKATAIQP